MNVSERPISVLVLCTGNSCRSFTAEVLLNELGAGRFVAHSTGSHPTGQVNSGAVRKLADEGHRTDGLSSKSCDAPYAGPLFLCS